MPLSGIYFHTIAFIHPSHALWGIWVCIKITEEQSSKSKENETEFWKTVQN